VQYGKLSAIIAKAVETISSDYTRAERAAIQRRLANLRIDETKWSDEN